MNRSVSLELVQGSVRSEEMLVFFLILTSSGAVLATAAPTTHPFT